MLASLLMITLSQATPIQLSESIHNDMISTQLLNSPPENVTINGPVRGKIGELYNYTFTCDDPDNDTVSYYIKWGTASCPAIYGPYPSSTPISIGNVWDKISNYTITCKAVDVHGAESPIQSLHIIMPHHLLSNTLFFQRTFLGH